jgi:hypothetical protein
MYGRPPFAKRFVSGGSAASIAAMYPACGVAVIRAALMESADRRPIKSCRARHNQALTDWYTD